MRHQTALRIADEAHAAFAGAVGYRLNEVSHLTHRSAQGGWGPVLFLAILFPAIAIAQEDDDEPQLLPGLVARYQAAGAKCIRRDDAVQFVWNDRSPDERLPAGNFSAQWQGQLLVMSPGKHNFYVFTSGTASLEIDGTEIVSGKTESAKWFDSPAIELDFGQHTIAVAFKKSSDRARIGLYWSGPQFDLEPVPGRALFHEPASDPGDAFERGAELWRALRCANCHRRPQEPAGLPAPFLGNFLGNTENIRKTWLVQNLLHGAKKSIGGMPRFGLDRDEAKAVVDYLLGPNPDKMPIDVGGDAKRGEMLFLTVGCLTCHRVGNVGSEGLFGGGDLSHIADKRPSDFFARWLADPEKINPAHRMPVFRLSDAERTDLATWLARLQARRAGTEKEASKARQEFNSDRGRKIIEAFRCGACHALPDAATPPPAIALRPTRAASDWEQTCLGSPDAKNARPGYDLPENARQALLAYLASPQPNADRHEDGRFVLRERNCLGCHSRDAAEGIAPTLARITEHKSELATILPTLAPPSLTSIGDKLHDTALADAISLRNPPLRPWLAVRMPRFDLSAAELAALTEYLTTIDRIPERPKMAPKLEEKALTVAGSRLVTSTGFGCTSCHRIGSSMPTNVALAARGTDLSLVGKRIRHEWFDRWVRNPARIVPRMEMPAIQIPARGVLGEKIDRQLAAVWHVLNLPGFEPPPSGPIRVARHPGDETPPMLITDVVEVGKQTHVRPVMVGLKNRHNLLFDLTSNRLVGWWLGDMANQQTRAKSWYWEPAGVNLLTAATTDGPELELFDGERPVPPAAMVGSSLGDIDWFETENDSLSFGYRLSFQTQMQRVVARVVQRIRPIDDAGEQGFQRRWEVEGIPEPLTLRLKLPTTNAIYRLEVERPSKEDLQPDDRALGIRLTATTDGQPAICEVRYLTAAQASPAPKTLPPVAEPAAKLSVVPGYDAERLPLPRSEMPTGVAWRDVGTLVMCSLKGSVWLVRDTNGDGLEDELTLVADGLAAPYGIACQGDAIDVATKFGVIRLSQLGENGRARRADVVASGWGYTADYHDWTIGLPRDSDGNYYVGLPCQQDDRLPSEAFLRGTVVRLQPRKPTLDLPRLFDLDRISAGLRFPMGLALDRVGELFATDNQGNYTPFNELNHLRRGARYGFINKLESKPGFQPPHEEPAIAVPHPWTRSVNGICFLYSPSTTDHRSTSDRFGPYEGHLIGCEFDTRRLIRMSLEKVGDTYQGAAYPFSVEPAAGEPTFEGPIVCAVSLRGDIYVGNLRDSGWGGGQNTGSIVRLRPTGQLPVGISEVHALADGFAIDFTGPVDRDRAMNPANYVVNSYRRIATPAYGGPDVDREAESIAAVETSPDSRHVRLRLRRMRPGFVYEFQVKNLTDAKQTFFPAEAYYTLKSIPTEPTGGRP